jgi:hypothetical protein
MRLGCQIHAQATTPPVKRDVTNFTAGRVDPAQVWTVAENLASTFIRYPDRPARSESLHRLSYPGPISIVLLLLMNIFLFLQLLQRIMVENLQTVLETFFSMP